MHYRPGRLKTNKSNVIRPTQRAFSPSVARLRPVEAPRPAAWLRVARRIHVAPKAASMLVPSLASAAPAYSRLVFSTLSSVASAVSVAAILHPLDVVKILQIREGNRVFEDQQDQPAEPSRRPSLLASARAIQTLVSRRGVGAAWTGVGISSVATAVSWGSFRFMYDAIRNHHVLVRMNLANSSRNAVAGSIASALTIIMTHPLFNAKSMLAIQAMKDRKEAEHKKIEGLITPLTDLYRRGGLRGLYRGVDSVLLAIPHNTIQMVAYEKLKIALPLYAPPATNPVGRAFQSLPSEVQATLKQASWALCSKALASTVTYPLNVVRVFQQHPPEHMTERDTVGVAKFIYHQEGPGAFFRGFGTHMQRVLLHNTLVFIVFERLQARRRDQVYCLPARNRGEDCIRLTTAPPLDTIDLLRARQAPIHDTLKPQEEPQRSSIWKFRPVFRRLDPLVSLSTVYRRTTSQQRHSH